MLNPTYAVLSPVAESGIKLGRMAVRLGSLEGKTLALVNNSKDHNRVFMRLLEEKLKARIPAITVRQYAKQSQLSVEPELLNQIARECDGVIHGIGD